MKDEFEWETIAGVVLGVAAGIIILLIMARLIS